jgi:serine/threonine protein kinase
VGESCRKAPQSPESPVTNYSRADLFDPNKDINSQADLLSYNPRREIDRSSFTITKKIGSGNFGTVSKGVLTGLYGENSKTTVAIKRTIGPAEGTELRDFLHEIKIMSYINPHINLVSMIGSCASDLDNEKEIWLIIEFCQYGDLKDFLIENKKNILSGSNEDTINDRCLMYWTYDIGKGMEYLSSNNIMHGDLAARNVMLDENPMQSGRLIAKV